MAPRRLPLCLILLLCFSATPALSEGGTWPPIGQLAGGTPRAVAIQGDYAYVAADAAMTVIDISLPSQPQQVAHCDTPGRGYRVARGVAVAGDYAYVADDWLGLRVISVADPANPVEVGYWDTPGGAREVAVGEDIVCLADYTWGLLVFVFAPSFSDVLIDHWAFWEIQACYNAGIVSGYDHGTYRPTWSVSRAQMAVFISRAVADGDANVPDGPAEATFDDVPTDHWAFKYVEYCAAEDIVQGYDPLTYGPTTPVSRDQMAVFITRAFNLPT